jgi:hypothetical protein
MSLSGYYQLVFALAQHHKYSITDIESMMPYERDLYTSMLIDHLETLKDNNKG